jgi:pimeloyl-ACP methyl ester carboxylesterase
MKEKSMNSSDSIAPALITGFRKLNSDRNFNLQLNRIVVWGGGDWDEMEAVTANITDGDSAAQILTNLGTKALNDGRYVNAAAYYRGAEWYTPPNDPQKIELYNKSRELFYKYYATIFSENGFIRRERVPFENGYLPLWVCLPRDKPIGTILLHGGYDSFIEEFLPIVTYLVNKNWAVYVFEGPGQGEALRSCGFHFTEDWHIPVKAILDHFELDDVTIIGLSLGGVLAPRAAAYEKRIRRVVGWAVMPNFYKVLMSTRSKMIQNIAGLIFKSHLAPLINLIMKIQMATDSMARWGVAHGMETFGSKTPYQYFQGANKMQLHDIREKIDQDFLLIGSNHDHFVPKDFDVLEIADLPNVRTLTYRLMTEKEGPGYGEHCNVGGQIEVLDYIMGWIKNITH